VGAEESLYLPLRNENVANWQIVHKHKKKERAKMCHFFIFFFQFKENARFSIDMIRFEQCTLIETIYCPNE